MLFLKIPLELMKVEFSNFITIYAGISHRNTYYTTLIKR